MATFLVDERVTRIYTATLLDEDSLAIPLSNLSAITLTLYDVATQAILNSRNDQDVLNANNVTVHATSGLLTWTMQLADNAIVSTSVLQLERHRALFEWTLLNGNQGKHEVDFVVRNLGMVA